MWTLASSFVAASMCSKGLHGYDAHSMGLLKKQNSRSASEFLRSTQKTFMAVPFSDTHHRGAIMLQPGHDGLRTAQRFQTRATTKYVAGTSSGAAEDTPISLNFDGHVLWEANDRIISEHTAPSSGPVSAG